MSQPPKTPEQAPKPASQQSRIAPQPDVIASRKGCAADGVGLSHYILMDRKAQ